MFGATLFHSAARFKQLQDRCGVLRQRKLYVEAEL